MAGGLLRWMLGRRRGPVPRLTEAEAVAIARGRLGGDVSIAIFGIETTPEGLVWSIGSATKGSGTMLTINDATGACSEPRRWGVR